MSSIYFSKYFLKSQGGETKEGALLKIDGGYSSLFCWPQFGDPSLDVCLSMLKEGRSHPLIERSIYFAHLDRDGINWSSSKIENHFHYNGGPIPSEFKLVKRKVDPFVIEWPTEKVQWRLDANNKFLNADHFMRFFRRLPDHVRENVVMVEDPCPFSPAEWEQLQEINLAWDWQEADAVENKKYYSTYVFKPARESREWIEKNMSDKKIMVTSYLDHPIGQLSALYEAQKLKEALGANILSCGLLTHSAYDKTPFSGLLKIDKNILCSPTEKNWGMKNLLESLSWEKLK